MLVAAGVVFDSYGKEDGTRKSGYGKYGRVRSNGSIKNQKTREEFEHVIGYEDGITSDFVLASCSVPVNYDYTTLNVENYALVVGGRSEEKEEDNKDIKDNNNEPSSSCSNDNNSSLHFFWDVVVGILLTIKLV
jgi:NTE family protein